MELGLQNIFEENQIYYKDTTCIMIIKMNAKMIDLVQGVIYHDKKQIILYKNMNIHRRRVYYENNRYYIKRNILKYSFLPFYLDNWIKAPNDYSIKYIY